MADGAVLTDLLERGRNVFLLAGNLGHAFHQEFESKANCYDPSFWSRHEPTFNEFWELLLGLRDEMQDRTTDFAPVADRLREAARVARRIRNIRRREEGWAFTAYLELFPELNTVALTGWHAVKDVIKSLRLDDPFAFLDEPISSNAKPIDTTPSYPKPRHERIASAACSVPDIMANVEPHHDGSIELVASHLVKRLVEEQHSLAAAHWAIHELIREEKLVAAEIESDLPGAYGAMGEGAQWTGGGKGTICIPEAKPAPFNKFKVVDTPSLWDWWRSLTNDPATQTVSDTSAAEIDMPHPPKRTKRSTERGEGRAKLIAALTSHHQYADGSCLNLEPIGNNELGRLAEVDPSTASAFFNKEFNNRKKRGHAKYKVKGNYPPYSPSSSQITHNRTQALLTVCYHRFVFYETGYIASFPQVTYHKIVKIILIILDSLHNRGDNASVQWTAVASG